jgi:hypothetical protein
MNVENEWTVYRTRFLVRACQLTEPLIFTDFFGREHCGEPGDYLVESSTGCFRITARQIFEDIYVPLDELPQLQTNKEPAGLESAFRSESKQERKQMYASGEIAGHMAGVTA